MRGRARINVEEIEKPGERERDRDKEREAMKTQFKEAQSQV